MPELGGPTTQSGILYQNSIAALFLGRLCDAIPRPDNERVLRVRVEAPTDVDDVVIIYADEHQAYIQAKENVRLNDEAWKKLWRDFDKQFHQEEFRRGRDRLILCVGTAHDDFNTVREITRRAAGSEDYQEWWGRLIESQRRVVDRIKPLLDTTLSTDETLRLFFGSVDVHIWTLDDIEQDRLPYWIPPSNQSSGTVFRLLRDRVGGEARIRRAFTALTLREDLRQDNVIFREPLDMNDLLGTVRACGAQLRQHKHTIARTDCHLRRRAVDDIVNWLRDPADEKRVAMLLDQAGMGKTVVMRDVLLELERNAITVLAIKADQQLSGVQSYEDLPTKLILPESVEHVIGRIAVMGPVVVLIDQIDALSLSLARDQTTLNIVIELIARLRLLPDVRILISCRTFDYNSDYHLKSIDARAPFHLALLSDDEIKEALQISHVDFDGLPNSTRQLLRTPLHLDLFMQVFGAPEVHSVATVMAFGLKSLQDLYNLLWNEVVLKGEPDSPPEHERIQVIRLLTEYMEREQRTSVPHAFFLEVEHHHLQPATRWLASAGILISSPTEWNFLHQTFFDYCYARHFVEANRDLAEFILQSDQDLRARPQLLQVLTYLRGTQERQYLQSVSRLLNTDNLRYHLRDVLLRWFGTLPSPTENELALALRMLVSAERRPTLLGAMSGNIGWLARLMGAPLQQLLALDDAHVDQQVIPYLASLIDNAQSEIAAILQPYFGHSDQWNNRLLKVLSRIRHWQSADAINLLERLIAIHPETIYNQIYNLPDITSVFPQVGCRFIRILLDRTLERYLNKLKEQQRQRNEQGPLTFITASLQSEMEQMSHHWMVEAFTAASTREPLFFLETMLPWIEQIVLLKPMWPEDRPYFSSDELASGWYDNIYDVATALVRSLISALTNLARTDSTRFRQFANHLATLPYATPQRLLCYAYRDVPDMYAEDAASFLQADRRRLHLGESGDAYDSRQLITAIYPFLPINLHAVVEEAILSWIFWVRPRDLHDLARRGLHQLYLLQAIPEQNLTKRGRRYLYELERKFPGYRASNDPRTIRSVSASSPISSKAAHVMTNRDWLRAIERYSDGKHSLNPFREGPEELARALQGAIKEQPERLFHLLEDLPDTIDDVYVTAFINGLSESEVSIEKLYTVIRRFSDQPGRRIGVTINWALEKRLSTNVPEDILAGIEAQIFAGSTAHEQPERVDGREVYNTYLNSERGTAMRTIMRYLDRQGGEDSLNRRWKLLEYAAADPSVVLRAGAIEELLYLMYSDRARAVALFEQLISGHQVLLASHFAADFIYNALYQHFPQILPFIRMMMMSGEEHCRQRGAELACIAAISPRALETEENLDIARVLVREIIAGEVVWRRGAARIFAHNITEVDQEYCIANMTTLLNDTDDQVRAHISGLFHQLRSNYLMILRPFLENYANSSSFYTQTHFFGNYLWANGAIYPDIVLSLINIAALNTRIPEDNPGYFDGDEFVRVVLRVYTDPVADNTMRHHAMDVFDLLMERYPIQAQHALDEWDQR